MEHVSVCTLHVVFSYLGFKCNSKFCCWYVLCWGGKITILNNTCIGHRVTETDKRSLHGAYHGQSLQLTRNATYFTSSLFYAHKVTSVWDNSSSQEQGRITLLYFVPHFSCGNLTNCFSYQKTKSWCAKIYKLFICFTLQRPKIPALRVTLVLLK